MSSEICIALTTHDNRAAAESLANALVERQLAACVNIIGPMQSIYRWQGAIEHNEEFLLIIKTDGSHLAQLEEAVLSLHSYETPEFLALNVAEASEPYTRWLLTCLPRNA